MGEDEGKVERVVGVGVGYTDYGINLMMDSEVGRGEYVMKCGCEKWFGEGFGLRGGLRIGSSEERVIGVGLSFGQYMFRIDYGFEYPLSGVKNMFGTHMMSLAMKFGEEGGEARINREEEMALTAIGKTQKEDSRKMKDEGKKKARAEEYVKEGNELIKQGLYVEALERVMVARSLVPGSREIGILYERLKEVNEIEARNVGIGKKWELMRKCVGKYINEKIRGSWNILMYVEEKYGKGEIEGKYEKLMRSRYGDLVGREKGISGMSWVDQKLYRALNSMYDNAYDKAIIECEEVLELEGNNELALSRLGSAYYLIGQKEKAKSLWKKVLELNPDNEEVKEFLKKEGESIEEIHRSGGKGKTVILDEYNESVKYYRYIEDKWDINDKIDLLRRIIKKYEGNGIDVGQWKEELIKLEKEAGVR